MSKLSPFTDYKGTAIRDGDHIRHPDGGMGTVCHMLRSDAGRGSIRPDELDWFVRYDDIHEDGQIVYLLLQLQVGDRGQARVVTDKGSLRDQFKGPPEGVEVCSETS